MVPTVAANCVSSGPVPRATFDRLTGEPLRLHGSMVLDDHPDAEGELLAAVRKQVGPAVPVVATLDLHAHVNLKTAQALGLTIPQSILLRADEVIR